MTASNVDARTQAWQGKWTVFKIPGFLCKRFLPFFPTPSQLFYWRHFGAVLDSRSSFFAPKPHRNACSAGYKQVYFSLKFVNILLQMEAKAVKNASSLL